MRSQCGQVKVQLRSIHVDAHVDSEYLERDYFFILFKLKKYLSCLICDYLLREDKTPQSLLHKLKRKSIEIVFFCLAQLKRSTFSLITHFFHVKSQ